MLYYYPDFAKSPDYRNVVCNYLSRNLNLNLSLINLHTIVSYGFIKITLNIYCPTFNTK